MRLAALLVVTVALVAALSPAETALAADVDPRVQRGEIVVTAVSGKGGGEPAAQVQALVDAPPEKVWAIVSDCANYKKNMPSIVDSKEIGRDGNVVTCQVIADLPFPLPDLRSKTRGVHTIEPGVRWERRWQLLEGDYTKNEGYWLLVPYDGGKQTVVTYFIDVAPNIAVPQSLVAKAQQSRLPEMMTNLRKNVAR